MSDSSHCKADFRAARIWGVPLLALILIAGCGKPANTPQPASDSSDAPRSSSTTTSTEHAHQAGAHGGTIVPLGSDAYHLEPVFGANGRLELYMLGSDETRVVDVESQSPAGFIREEGSQTSTEISLKPAPQQGDAPERTSRFEATLPAEFAGKSVEITIPNLVINGERFRASFRSEALAGHGDIPEKVPASAENALYLTSAGKYTDADIEANGRQTASQKFKGLISNHDAKPAVGDRICPISKTKANEKFTWVIAGKPYQFCCPPCVDEFVKLAKEEPEKLQAPESYVKN